MKGYLEAFSVSSNNDLTLIGRIHEGKQLGELGVLNNTCRSLTVRTGSKKAYLLALDA